MTIEWRKLRSQMLHVFLFTKYCEEDKTRKINGQHKKKREKIKVHTILIENRGRKNLGDRDVNSRIILK